MSTGIDMPDHTFLVPPSCEVLLAMLRTLPTDAICLVGYLGEDGNYHALKESDLKAASDD